MHDATPHVPAETDEALFDRVRSSGDAAAFAELVHRYQDELFCFLRRSLGCTELAEDVFQATFLKVHLKRDSFQAGRRFRPWLYAIATHQAIDARRSNRRHQSVDMDRRAASSDAPSSFAASLAAPAAADGAEAGENAEWLRAAVARLSAPQRDALTLVYQRGLRHAEAARLLHIPVGTVKSRLHSAIHTLGDAWRLLAQEPVHATVAPAARGV
jgi:RNA polymerase sigma-70 factor (ECF subfamily)